MQPILQDPIPRSWSESVNRLNPNKHQNSNSRLLPLFIFYRSSGEWKLIKYQATSSCVIMSVILITTLFYKALILQGEI